MTHFMVVSFPQHGRVSVPTCATQIRLRENGSRGNQNYRPCSGMLQSEDRISSPDSQKAAPEGCEIALSATTRPDSIGSLREANWPALPDGAKARIHRIP